MIEKSYDQLSYEEKAELTRQVLAEIDEKYKNDPNYRAQKKRLKAIIDKAWANADGSSH
ncbi:hypothetical protein FD04_GL000809 [Secundilactobacillus odoratitofui DSM 19909 = JCM 15043]|uniref:Uncharacterized protein n=1 Tax=Secundilactobacillus odoratitofui DSM 19909 = JCM 15043 TaxID=1423776 RepID=A0A0R1LPW5_9LACO|nr:hypothetical protein [Secundilactobacillus odoratitofui]KRK97837.1 hypothetical protein FD04_GL000809 [Secundilactobacillus odoratitofui DSM 19909 = JCM 15043]